MFSVPCALIILVIANAPIRSKNDWFMPQNGPVTDGIKPIFIFIFSVDFALIKDFFRLFLEIFEKFLFGYRSIKLLYGFNFF